MLRRGRSQRGRMKGAESEGVESGEGRMRGGRIEGVVAVTQRGQSRKIWGGRVGGENQWGPCRRGRRGGVRVGGEESEGAESEGWYGPWNRPWAVEHKTTVLCAECFWCGQHLSLGQVGGGWALEISPFRGPKWHSPGGSMQFYRAKKSLDFQDQTPLQLALVMDAARIKSITHGPYK